MRRLKPVIRASSIRPPDEPRRLPRAPGAAGANLTPVGVIESEGPRFCTSCGQGDHAPSLNLMVHLGEDVIRVSALGTPPSASTRPKLAADDDAGLYRLLAEAQGPLPPRDAGHGDRGPAGALTSRRRPRHDAPVCASMARCRIGPLSRTPPALDDRGRPALLFPM
ncbi:MAG: hypothetical protein R3F43_09135 [bacterium]